jgi:hypothetical protein
MFRWLFEPYDAQYEPNWSSQVYNRMWTIICIFVNPLSLSAFGICACISKNKLLCLCGVIIAIGLVIFNFIQLGISERHYWDTSKKLYDKLNGNVKE